MNRPPITIRFALIGLLLACVVPLASGLAVSAYLNSRETIDLMWRDLATELVDGAREKTLRHIEPGAGQLRLLRLRADSGELDPDDHQRLLETLRHSLLAHPAFTWCSYGADDGCYFSAYRSPDGQTRLTRRLRRADVTEQRDWIVAADGSLEPLADRTSDFDSRARPWWPVGAAAEEPAWARPFLFASRRQPGVVLTLRQERRDGSLRGVWLVEYELSQIAEFLQQTKQDAIRRGGPFGQADVYIVSDDQMVVGHPQGVTVRGEGDDTGLIPATEHPDPQLNQAYRQARDLGLGQAQRFHFEVDGRHFLGMSSPFDAADGPQWTALVTLPAEALLGPIHRNNRTAAIIAGVVALVSVLFGLTLADRLARPLTRLAGDLDRIGRLEFDSDPIQRGSRVREIADMISARDRMTSGLQSFSKYVPAALVRQLITRGQEASLGGETRELTVFFSDIAGFTSMAEEMANRELVDQLAEHFGQISRIIDEELGTVDKYVGDSIMAFWGAPSEVDNHALSACRAALRAQDSLARMREQQRQLGQPEISARIGINSGEVLVGNIGAENRMNYTVIGDAVNVASRLEQQCKTCRVPILIGERTRQLAGDGIIACPVDKILVEGRQRGLIIYQLLALRDEASASAIEVEQLARTAFDAYLAGDFQAAARILADILADTPARQPLQQLGEQCKSLAKDPPADWNGIFHQSHAGTAGSTGPGEFP